jgi:hypothetical protein
MSGDRVLEAFLLCQLIVITFLSLFCLSCSFIFILDEKLLAKIQELQEYPC